MPLDFVTAVLQLLHTKKKKKKLHTMRLVERKPCLQMLCSDGEIIPELFHELVVLVELFCGGA